jgi:4'-phosphopantetheinyl transferase
VENVTARTAPLAIANRFFTAREAGDLASLPPAEQSARFYALWTLKESWIKATGLGIGAGLGNVSFEFGRDHQVTRTTFANDDARLWMFWQARPTTKHQLALALRRATGQGTQVKMWRCVPGTSRREPLGQEQGAEA